MSTIGPASSRRFRLWVPIGVHTVADTLAFVTIALIPLFEARLGLTDPQKALTIGLGATTSGLIQPVTAWLMDRFHADWIGTMGLGLAAALIACIGLTDSFPAFLTVYLVAAAGMGAFHPAAAAAVGAAAGEARRGTMLSVFFLAGMVGGMAGNVGTPIYIESATEAARAAVESAAPPDALAAVPQRITEPLFADAGLASLVLLIIPGAFATLLLARAIHGRNAPVDLARGKPATWKGGDADMRRRWVALGVLWFCNAIRFSVNNALVYLTVEWTKALTLARNNASELDTRLGLAASEMNGPLQAAMQLGMGGGGVVLGLFLARRFEKLAFVVIPALGALAIAVIPAVASLDDAFAAGDPGAGPGGWAGTVPVAFVLTALAGVGFGSVIPVSLSLGQRLLPHRASLASGVLLGGAWGFAIIGPQLARLVHEHASLTIAGIELDGIACGYIGSAAALLVASVAALKLTTD